MGSYTLPAMINDFGLRKQFRIVTALVVREMMMRYGRSNIGFLWVILEPMILTTGVMLIWSLGKSPYEHGLQVVAIVMTGYLPLTLFRHLTNGAVHLYRSNISNLYHRHISLIDLIIAKSLLEFLGTSTAFLVVYSILTLTGIASPIVDITLVLGGWLSMAILSFGFATFIAAVTEMSETTERFIQPLQYLIVPLSGCFFMVEWMPKNVQSLLWYVPFVHCYEMFRAGFFGAGITTHYDWWYPLIWALVFTTTGLLATEKIRDKLNT